jgi:hypothetical protein
MVDDPAKNMIALASLSSRPILRMGGTAARGGDGTLSRCRFIMAELKSGCYNLRFGVIIVDQNGSGIYIVNIRIFHSSTF